MGFERVASLSPLELWRNGRGGIAVFHGYTAVLGAGAAAAATPLMREQSIAQQLSMMQAGRGRTTLTSYMQYKWQQFT